jgi:hypothetical protein
VINCWAAVICVLVAFHRAAEQYPTMMMIHAICSSLIFVFSFVEEEGKRREGFGGFVTFNEDLS